MWHTLHVEVVTPVFNSAGTQGTPHLHTPPEIRVPSLRGGMRFWLRAMAARYVGDDPHLLRKVEDRVLGSTEQSSPISMRVPEQPAQSKKGLWNFTEDPTRKKWISYMVGPGFPTHKKDFTEFIPPGSDARFDLKVRPRIGREPEFRCALAALWLLLTYGGVGARIRRGFGQLRIRGGDMGEFFENPDAMLTPGIEHYKDPEERLDLAGPAEACQEDLRAICAGFMGHDRAAPAWGDPPITPFPVLGRRLTMSGISSWHAGSWHEAFVQAGLQLRYFRAADDAKHPDNEKYEPPIKTRAWHQVVHGNSGRHDTAMLGLPIVYNKQASVSIVDREGKELRRASPLWLRVVPENEDSWRLFSFCFRSEFFPHDKGIQVELRKNQQFDKTLEVSTEKALELAETWISAQSKGVDFTEKRLPRHAHRKARP